MSNRVYLSYKLEPVAPNTFKSIKAGFPIELHGNLYLVLNVSPCVKAPASDGSEDRKDARIFLHKLTKSGSYSWGKSACCFAYVRMSGYVEDVFMPFLDVTRPKIMWLSEYNNLVRTGRPTEFHRHRHFEVSFEAGIEGSLAVEASKTWDGWYT